MNTAPTLQTALFLAAATLTGQVLAQDAIPATQPDQAAQAQAPAAQPDDAAQDPATALPDMPPAASRQDVSYSIGYTIGAEMVQRGSDLDADQLVEGIKAGLGENEARLTPDQMAQSLFSFQMQMQQKHFAKAKENLDQGMAYLAQNAKQQGVTVTDSGLQYKVIKSGDGPTPTMQDVVAAHYRGTLPDGTEFDSSPEGEPVAFPVARVIPGWVEALQMMKIGDKWELTIPADLAYGEAGDPRGAIGPNQVLRFEIELVEIR
jgi:FKBP-type peptidyl-prolyl cis-trans isomerase FklB